MQKCRNSTDRISSQGHKKSIITVFHMNILREETYTQFEYVTRKIYLLSAIKICNV